MTSCRLYPLSPVTSQHALTHTKQTTAPRRDRREELRRLCDEIKSVIDYRSFYAEFCSPSRVTGGRLHGMCPIPAHDHSGGGNPSFSVDLARGLFHCFSRDEGGDAVRFYELMHNVSFGRAVSELAARLDLGTKCATRRRQVPIRLRAAPDSEVESEPLGVEQTARVCAEFLRLCLMEDQHEGRNYLLRRGINAETIERAAVAYFPLRAYSRVMRGMQREIPPDDLRRSGLFNRREHLTFYRHRLFFPFMREKQAVYLQARAIAPGVEPRWHNMRGTIPMLYNAEALSFLPSGETVYLVEGFTDTLTLLSHNFHAVGLVGAGGLREEWLPELERFRVVSVLDPDAAGRHATLRYAEMFAERGMQLASVSLTSDVNDFFRTNAAAALELTLLAETAQEEQVSSNGMT